MEKKEHLVAPEELEERLRNEIEHRPTAAEDHCNDESFHESAAHRKRGKEM